MKFMALTIDECNKLYENWALIGCMISYVDDMKDPPGNENQFPVMESDLQIC